jgi:predicted N-acyltransferase
VTHNSIEEVDPRLWDSILDPDDLQASHAFVQAVERSSIEDAVFRHTLGYHRGQLAFHASFCRMTVSLDLLAGAGLRIVARSTRAVYPRFLRVPVLFCGLPVSFGQSSLRFAPDGPAERWPDDLAALMDELAHEMDAALLCIKEFREDEAAALSRLTDLGYLRLPSLPGNSLNVRWGSFQEYVASMRAGYRRQVRSDLRAASEEGLAVEWLTSLESERDRLYELYEQVMARAEHRLEKLTPAFFEQLERRLPGAIRGLLLRHGDETVAAAITLSTPRTLTFLLAGIDYGASHDLHAYSNLVTEIVRYGIDSGVQKVEMGQTSDALKSRLGSVSTPRWLFLRARSRSLQRLISLGARRLFPTTQAPDRRVFRS